MKARTRLFSVLLASAFVCLSLHADNFVPRTVPGAPAMAKIEVQADNNMPLVQAKVNGRPCTLLFDTGATHTTFDLAFIEKQLPEVKLERVALAGETNVEGQPQLFHADSLVVGQATFGDFDAMALAMPHLSDGIGAHIDGILGMNVIGATRTLVSFGTGKVAFGLPVAVRDLFGKPVRRRTSDPFSIDLAAEVAGKPLKLIVDSASSFTFLDRSCGWKATGAADNISAIDINGGGNLAPVRGEPGEIVLGVPVRISPLLTPAPLNRIGADTLLKYDLLIERRAVAFKELPSGKPGDF